MVWKIDFSRNVIKDAKKLKSANLDSNLKSLLEILKQNPYEPPMINFQATWKDIFQDESISNIVWFIQSTRKLILLGLFLYGHTMNREKVGAEHSHKNL